MKKSRLSSCMVVSIDKPSFDLRMEILRTKTKILDLEISEDLLSIIAEGIDNSVRELEAMLYKVITYCQLSNTDINEKIVRKLVDEYQKLYDLEKTKTKSKFFRSNGNNKTQKYEIHPSIILEKVTSNFNISIEELTSKKRTNELLNARKIAIALIRKFTRLNLNEIGKMLGNRNYSTIIYLLNSLKNSQQDKEINKNLLAKIEKELQELIVLEQQKNATNILS